MLFNPNRTYETAPGCIARVLQTEYRPEAPMGNIAASNLADVIRSWLVGLSIEIGPVISRSIEWLDQAIAADEASWFGSSPNFHRMTLHWAKALGLWMQNSENAVGIWDKVRSFDLAALQGGDVCEKNQVPTYWLDDHMAFCFQAEQFESGVAEFERYHEAKTLSLKKTLKPRELAYALCLHKARGQFDVGDLSAAGRKMLRAKLEQEWLGHGQFIRAATWLKIVHSHSDPKLTSLQTVLKAYEDMPHVVRPGFV